MSGARDHLDRRDPRSGAAATRPSEQAPAPAIAGPADPRLEHGGAGTAGELLSLQRTAGNAAVSSLVGSPVVQRVVEIDEISSEVATASPEAGPESGPAPGQEPAATGGGPVTSDGASTTVSGGVINLAAPLTQSDGIIRADTIIANSVVASSYTPGAGNEW